MSLSFLIHMVLHIGVPFLVAALFYKDQFWRASLIMLGGLAIDADHLLVRPILDPDRCSVGFHLLHQYWTFPIYIGLALYPKTRLVGLGLVIHIILDWIDCFGK